MAEKACSHGFPHRLGRKPAERDAKFTLRETKACNGQERCATLDVHIVLTRQFFILNVVAFGPLKVPDECGYAIALGREWGSV